MRLVAACSARKRALVARRRTRLAHPGYHSPVGRASRRGWRASRATPSFRTPALAHPGFVLYFCIPAYNEAPTVGLLIWRLRKVFQEQPREYEVLVYDDGSTDATAETLAPYHKVMPLSVLGGTRVGYAARRGRAVPRSLAPHALSAARRRHPAAGRLHRPARAPARAHQALRRRRGHRGRRASRRRADRAAAGAHAAPRRARGSMRPFVSVAGVRDPFGTLRLYPRVGHPRPDQGARRRALLDGRGLGAPTSTCCCAPRRMRVASRRWSWRRATTCARARPASAPGATHMALLRFARGARGRSVRAARA